MSVSNQKILQDIKKSFKEAQSNAENYLISPAPLRISITIIILMYILPQSIHLIVCFFLFQAGVEFNFAMPYKNNVYLTTRHNTKLYSFALSTNEESDSAVELNLIGEFQQETWLPENTSYGCFVN